MFCFPISDHVMPSLEIAFCFFISYTNICTCMRTFARHLKETIPSSSITWSEMGKQNIQAKEVHFVVQTGIAFPKGTVKFGFSQFFLFLIFCLVVCWLVCLSAVRVESNDFLFQIFLEWCNWSVSALNQKTGFLSGQKMFLFRVSRLQVYTVLLAVYLKIIDIK